MTLGALPTSEMIDRAVYRRIADQLVAEVRLQLLAMREECYGGVAISDRQADERARAIVGSLLGNYAVTELE